MFNKVVIFSVNKRVQGSDSQQELFRDLLSHLRNGCMNHDDWQPTSVANLEEFQDATRLFYSNEEVANYDYTKLKQLCHPLAKIEARHSSETAKKISPQELFGLQPSLLLAKGAVVMLTVNLWASVGLCNGASGTIIDIIYHTNQKPPDLPIAVIVRLDNYRGLSLANFSSCVPIPPITATVDSVHERQQLPLRLAWGLTKRNLLWVFHM